MTLTTAYRLALRASIMALLPVFFIQCNTARFTSKSPNTEARPVRADTKEAKLRQEIVDYARQYVGKNYKPAGKVPSTGFDCSGFTSYVMKNFDIKLSPSARDQVKQGRPKPVTDVKPGDLIFFRRGPDQPIFHVALVVSNSSKSLKVIHSTTSRGVVIDDIYASSYWKPKIDSAREVVN